MHSFWSWYTTMSMPKTHPFADGRKTVYVHVYKAECVLGRRLKKGECVHHIDGDKANNDNSNLLICTHPYHMALHAREARLILAITEGELQALSGILSEVGNIAADNAAIASRFGIDL